MPNPENVDSETFEKSMAQALLNLINVLNKTPPIELLEQSIMQNGFIAQGVSGYLSYLLQKGLSKQTEALIKWNRVLAISTIALAGATFTLALITYFR